MTIGYDCPETLFGAFEKDLVQSSEELDERWEVDGYEGLKGGSESGCEGLKEFCSYARETTSIGEHLTISMSTLGQQMQGD